MPADEITPMSQVETEGGVASIVEVERVRYDGMVYNLLVGTAEEMAAVSGLNRTMFAGGIRVGDNEMQSDMELQSKRAHARRQLSPAWETDRKNAMARKHSAASKAGEPTYPGARHEAIESGYASPGQCSNGP